MDNKTESYIILKPISERFNKIAKDISDDEIRSLIKSSIREEIQKVDFAFQIQEIVNDYLDENNDYVVEALKKSISKRLS